MKSFHFIARAPAAAASRSSRPGISEALVATALGLGVAVVAVAFYNYFEARLERIEAALPHPRRHIVEAAPAALAA